MSYQIKTSYDNWLNKVIELHLDRISMKIVDDGEYGVKNSAAIKRILTRSTLKQQELFFLILFYLLAIVCGVLFIFSLSLAKARLIGEILAILSICVCIAIPTYYLWKNRPPKIKHTEEGIDVNF